MNEKAREKEPVIELIKLTKIFRDFWHREKVKAVDNLSLEIYPGEVFGLLGPNGSGKTTTLKLLLGLLFPTSGLVRVFGRSPKNINVKARLGFLPEESYFYRHLSAEETMGFYGALFGLPSSDSLKRGRKLLEMLGLLSSQTRPVGEYSKGMMRRIGLAQALINDPELVILDEPTSGLDPIGRKEVKNLIIQLKKLGKTVLLSSHLLSEVQDVCDRICILYAGRKIAEGEVGEVLRKKETATLSFPYGSREAAESILAHAEEKVGRGKAELSNPVETLEEFFLREIDKLDDAKRRKASAKETSFEELSLIARLAREEPSAPPPPPEKKEPSPPPPGGRDVLDELTVDREAAKKRDDEQKEKQREEETARKENVLKDLLGGDE